MKYKVYNRYDIPTKEDIKCSQIDNIEREGYMSVEELNEQFIRAGVNKIEWLKKAYPEQPITEAQMLANSQAMKDGIDMRKADALDVLDESRRAEARVKRTKEDLTELEKKTKEKLDAYKASKEEGLKSTEVK